MSAWRRAAETFLNWRASRLEESFSQSRVENHFRNDVVSLTTMDIADENVTIDNCRDSVSIVCPFEVRRTILLLQEVTDFGLH